MIPGPVKILKAEQVVIDGSVRLEIGGGAPVRTASSAQADTSAGVPEQARILESNNEYAIIEVTCGCGAKSHIQCNYSGIAKDQEE